MCSICAKTPCDPHCPNYKLPKAMYYCDVCRQGIYDGEEYIENDNGDKRHYDCFCGIRDLLKWLGYSIKTTESSDD